ncbi:hypothetical protein [Indioceanicola profundi]|uniref:hypothetical protein n=1 Tax=Indioceanicola profundi TaxID=2220096 RepID=UPI0013C460F7|nr:hypothetical protein [Indioceanicola profundi]
MMDRLRRRQCPGPGKAELKAEWPGSIMFILPILFIIRDVAGPAIRPCPRGPWETAGYLERMDGMDGMARRTGGASPPSPVKAAG